MVVLEVEVEVLWVVEVDTVVVETVVEVEVVRGKFQLVLLPLLTPPTVLSKGMAAPCAIESLTSR